MNLNQKQKQVLEYIKDYIDDKGFPPSIWEICRKLGFASPRAGQKYLESLEEQGYIQRESKPRGIRSISELIEEFSFMPNIILPYFSVK